MVPSSQNQIRWGQALALFAVVATLVLAFVPDPFHRQRLMTVGLDQVEGIATGAPVFFRGAQVGTVRAVELVPRLRTFDLTLGIRRDWQPSACSFLTVSAANPFTQPHLELVALETPAVACPAARTAAACDPVAPVVPAPDRLPGCRRAPDLIALATRVVTQAAGAAQVASATALKLQGMLTGGGGSVAAGGLGAEVQDSVHALAGVLGGVRQSLAPGRGDLALTLANVRRASGRAAALDVGAVNGTLGSVQALMADNRAAVGRIVTDAQGITAQSRDLLQATSTSLAQTSANLARVSGSVDTLTERLATDPGFAVRGQRFADPPPVTGK